MRVKAGKILLISLGIGGSAYAGKKLYDDGKLDLAHSGPARFGRAAIAVGLIGIDYKRSLFSRSSPPSDSPEYIDLKTQVHQRSADKLLDLCNINGGCFIKVGQHMGALDYLLPEEYVQTMRVLHSKAPRMDLKDVYAVLKDEMGVDPEDIFAEFDEEPLGTASLAQVHKAVLKDSGDVVAVKVQHRFVKKHSFVDIYTMDFLVRVVNFVFPQFEFMWLADEMRKNLPVELNFQQEGRNAEKFANMFDHYHWLKVPKIYWKLSTNRVLTMQYCSGGHINDKQYMKDHDIDTEGVSKKISTMYAEMIFKHGYVHCDPHPGNVLVNKNQMGEDEVVLLDHGLYTQLTNEFRLNYSQFWLSILKADLKGIKQYADELGVGQLHGLFACMVTGRSWNSIMKGIDKAEKNAAESQEVKDNAARYVKEITDVLAYVNRQMILIFKTNDLLRNIELSLGTHTSMSSFVQMSRACFRCLRAHQTHQCGTQWCRVKIGFLGQLDQLKISFYQVFLWLWWSKLGRICRKVLTF